MRIEIEPFRRRHVREAAQLLAARQRRARALCPSVPASFEDEEMAGRALKEAGARWGTRGVAAVAGGRLRGFLIGTRAGFAGPRDGDGDAPAGWVLVRLAGHAVEPTDAYELYGSMYAALAPVWLEDGCRTHVVDVLAADRAAVAAWASLGFGQRSVVGVRASGRLPAAGTGADVDIRRAGTGEVEAALLLARSLQRHHLRAPMFFQEAAEDDELRATLSARLADEQSPIWLAWRRGRPLGMISAGTSPILDALACPARSFMVYLCITEPEARGLGVALFRHALEAARGEGLDSCTAGWQSANLLSARVCTTLGFRPQMYRLARVIERLQGFPSRPGSARTGRLGVS